MASLSQTQNYSQIGGYGPSQPRENAAMTNNGAVDLCAYMKLVNMSVSKPIKETKNGDADHENNFDDEQNISAEKKS